MNAYKFNDDGYYIGKVQVQILNHEILLPQNCTVKIPLDLIIGKVNRFVDDEWVLTTCPIEVFSCEKLLEMAWLAANDHAISGMDENSRVSLLWMAMDPNCPTLRMHKIVAVQLWWQSIWNHYALVKESISQGNTTFYDPTVAGDSPYTIWQIAGD